MDKRCNGQQIQGVLLCYIPRDLRSVRCDVAERSEHSFHEIDQPLLFIPLSFRSETALGEAIHASLDTLATDDEGTAAGIVILSDGASTTGRPDAM